MAAGRVPCLDGLIGQDVDLEVERGHLKVDCGLQTCEPGIYAIGDVAANKKLACEAAAREPMLWKRLQG